MKHAVADARLPVARLSPCGRFLQIPFHSLHLVWSWAVVGGGPFQAKGVIWHQVSDRDLGKGVDPRQLLIERIDSTYGPGTAAVSIGFLTGVPLKERRDVYLEMSGIAVRCTATVGLNNALRVGDLPNALAGHAGTINVLLQTSIPLSDAAALEALSLVSEARTVAVLEGGLKSIEGARIASGTGTDCIAVAYPIHSGVPRAEYAGKHTILGHLIGSSCHTAIAEGVAHQKRLRATQTKPE
jgi:adenosylcobinamide amidohydrolase